MLFVQVDESTGNAIVWRTGFGGELVSTVRVLAGALERIRNDTFKAAFEFEKLIFATRRRHTKTYRE